VEYSLSDSKRKESRILSYHDLRERGILYSRMHLRRLMAEGKFPQQIKMVPGGRRIAWLEEEVDQWIESRAEARHA
jgi:prophage regulatory protein